MEYVKNQTLDFILTLYQVLKTDPQNRDAKLRLAEVYEAQNEPKKALALIYEGNHYAPRGHVLLLINM